MPISWHHADSVPKCCSARSLVTIGRGTAAFARAAKIADARPTTAWNAGSEAVSDSLLDNVAKDLRFPPLRDLAQLGVFEGVGEEVGEGLGQAGIAAFGFGADGVEVHEPRLEEGPRHCLQRLVHPPVQLDLVVQRAENVGDGALLREWRQGYWQLPQDCEIYQWHR